MSLLSTPLPNYVPPRTSSIACMHIERKGVMKQDKKDIEGDGSKEFHPKILNGAHYYIGGIAYPGDRMFSIELDSVDQEKRTETTMACSPRA